MTNVLTGRKRLTGCKSKICTAAFLRRLRVALKNRKKDREGRGGVLQKRG